MIFTKLKLNYFGQFTNREIELKPGINLIYGENEAGKSTIHTFIRGMLFGIERLRGRGAASKEDIYTRYLPWDYPGAYGGSLDLRIGDKDYRLQRSLHVSDKSFVILDLATGREVKLKEGLIGELLPGLTESAYKNTISMEQLKAATDAELAAQVRNYIANLSIAKSKEVNVVKAITSLTDQRKQLETVQNTAQLKALQAAIDAGLEKEERLEQLTGKLRELLVQEQRLLQHKSAIADQVDRETVKRMEQLPAVLEQYRSYQELIRQENNLRQQEQILKEKIEAGEKEYQASASLREDVEQLGQLQGELYDMDKAVSELEGEEKRLNKRVRESTYISILPCVALGLLIWSVTGFQPVGWFLLWGLAITGGALCILLTMIRLRKLKAFLNKKKEQVQKRAFLQTQLTAILGKYGLARMEELPSRQEAVIRNSYELEHARKQQEEQKQGLQELEDKRDVLYETIMKYLQNFTPEEELTDGAIERLQQAVEEKRRETSGMLAQLNRQQEDLRLGIEKLRWEISTLEGNEEELQRNRESYKELEQRQREAATEQEAVKLALSVIQELSTEIHDSFGQQLNSAVTKVISRITGQKYKDIKVDEKLEVKVGWKDDYVLLERLSAGTMEQVYFALRMAVADLLLGRDEAPLLLDDSLALYDESRVKACLRELSERKQVILFTCHKREQQLLKELDIAYHLVELSQG